MLFREIKSRVAAALSNEDGSALAETALVAPMLIALMIGVVEVGRYADYSIKVTNAARAGVQYGAQSIATAGDLTAIQNAALADAKLAGVSLAGMTAVASTYCTYADGTADAGCAVAATPSNHRIIYVKVVTTGSMTSIFNYQFPGLSAAQNASLNSFAPSTTAVMRVAGQ